MIEGFVHPALALGALLAVVPLVIHLLNRRRHRPLPWAAMQFVLAAYRRTRRRARLENLLLLLLRMAAVALLALALARPFTGGRSPLAPLTESRRDVVLLLDGSASTGYREGVQTVFEGIADRARELLEDLDGTRGDRVRLVLAASTPRLLSARSPEDALAVLPTLATPAPEPLDLPGALAEVARWAEEDAAGTGASGLEVRLLTDLQRSVFFPPPRPTVAVEGEEPEVPPLQGTLDRLRELGVEVVVEDLGPAPLDPPNLAVEAVRTPELVLGPGVPVEVGVTVASFGRSPGTARVALEVDGERQPSRLVDLPARGRTEVALPVVFQDPGHHAVVARLEGDRLPLDDVRARVLRVPPPLRVLLVNGAPAAEIERDEVGYLRAVLEPPDEAWLGGAAVASERAPFQPTVVSDLDLASGDVDLGLYDVIVLANASAPPGPIVERLEARVAAGAALVLTLGDRVEADRERWNELLWRADGSGLSPARLGPRVEVADRREGYYRAAELDVGHPALSFFADERWRPLLSEVPVWSFLATEPVEEASALARLDDDGRHALLLERPYDRGRVLLWTTTIDPAWTKLPESPATLIPLVHELLRYAGRGVEPPRNVPVGSALVAEVESFPRGLVVEAPDGSRRTLDGEPTQVGEGLWALPPVAPADQPGVWRVLRDDAPPIAFGVQIDPAESDLLRATHEELARLHPALRPVGPESPERRGGEDAPRRGELWRWLAGLCLAALVAESLWAAWIGRRRRIA